jgi:hypothetical protein
MRCPESTAPVRAPSSHRVTSTSPAFHGRRLSPILRGKALAAPGFSRASQPSCIGHSQTREAASSAPPATAPFSRIEAAAACGGAVRAEYGGAFTSTPNLPIGRVPNDEIEREITNASVGCGRRRTGRAGRRELADCSAQPCAGESASSRHIACDRVLQHHGFHASQALRNAAARASRSARHDAVGRSCPSPGPATARAARPSPAFGEDRRRLGPAAGFADARPGLDSRTHHAPVGYGRARIARRSWPIALTF